LTEIANSLKDNNNDVVRRAAVALAELGDSTVVLPLVDALITSHTHVLTPTPDEMIDEAMGRTSRRRVTPSGKVIEVETKIAQQIPEGGISAGEPAKPKVVKSTVKNEEVLNALIVITGKDFGFEKKRWIDWLKEEDRRVNAKKLK
jgi:hypothetical protein